MMDLEGLRTAVGEMDEGRVNALLGGFLASQPTEEEARAVLAACQQGMDIVGERFGDGRYFVGDLIFAGSMLAGAVEKLKPLLGFGAGDFSAGTVVLGTVEGDIHFIGKNLFKTMAEAANFRVIDLGTNVPPEKFIEAARQHNPDLIGLSALLTTTMPAMKDTVDALNASKDRARFKVLVGGAPITQDFANQIGADSYAPDAASAAKAAKALV